MFHQLKGTFLSEPETIRSGVLKKEKVFNSASHKWVKPFPLRGGFPAPLAECGLYPPVKSGGKK